MSLPLTVCPILSLSLSLCPRPLPNFCVRICLSLNLSLCVCLSVSLHLSLSLPPLSVSLSLNLCVPSPPPPPPPLSVSLIALCVNISVCLPLRLSVCKDVSSLLPPHPFPSLSLLLTLHQDTCFLSLPLFLRLSFFLSACPSVWLSVSVPARPSVCCLQPPLCLSQPHRLYLLMCLSVSLSVRLSVHPSLCPSLFDCLSLSLSLCPCLYLCLSVSLPPLSLSAIISLFAICSSFFEFCIYSSICISFAGSMSIWLTLVYVPLTSSFLLDRFSLSVCLSLSKSFCYCLSVSLAGMLSNQPTLSPLSLSDYAYAPFPPISLSVCGDRQGRGDW